MGVEILPQKSMGFMSPRISIFNNMEENKTPITPMNTSLSTRLDHILTDPTFDFTFNIGSNITFKSSTADELFSNGKIIPSGIKNEKEVIMPCLDPTSQMVGNQEINNESLKEFVDGVIEEKDEQPNKTIQRSFWKFGRSRSLHCEKNQLKGFMGSLKMLPRSGSTGKCLGKIIEEEDNVGNPNKKPFWKLGKSRSLNSSSKDLNTAIAGAYPTSEQKNLSKHVNGFNLNLFSRRSGSLNSSKDLDTAISGVYPNLEGKNSSKRVYGFNLNPFIRRSSSLNCDTRKWGSDNCLARSFSTGYVPKKEQQSVANDAKTCKKRQVRSNSKGCGYGNYGINNNVRVAYVLNIPPPYISWASVDLFGFGSLCNGYKNRKNRE